MSHQQTNKGRTMIDKTKVLSASKTYSIGLGRVEEDLNLEGYSYDLAKIIYNAISHSQELLINKELNKVNKDGVNSIKLIMAVMHQSIIMEESGIKVSAHFQKTLEKRKDMKLKNGNNLFQKFERAIDDLIRRGVWSTAKDLRFSCIFKYLSESLDKHLEKQVIKDGTPIHIDKEIEEVYALINADLEAHCQRHTEVTKLMKKVDNFPREIIKKRMVASDKEAYMIFDKMRRVAEIYSPEMTSLLREVKYIDVNKCNKPAELFQINIWVGIISLALHYEVGGYQLLKTTPTLHERWELPNPNSIEEVVLKIFDHKSIRLSDISLIDAIKREAIRMTR